MGSTFDTNPIRKIGSNTQPGTNFEYHEVAWVFPCQNEQPLCDSSLQVDGDPDPTGGHFLPTLGINTPLGVSTGHDYHFRLGHTLQTEQNAERCLVPGCNERLADLR